MKTIDFLRGDKLSTWKWWASAKIIWLVNDWELNQSLIRAMKDLWFSEWDILNRVTYIINHY